MPASQHHQYSPQHEYSAYPEDNDLVLAMLSRRERLDVNSQDGSNGAGRAEEDDDGMDNEDRAADNNDDMNIEPSAVPPYWSFSTTRTQLVERPPQEGESPAMLLPPTTSATASTSSFNAPSGIDEDSVLPTMASLLSPPYINLPSSLRSENGDHHHSSNQQQHMPQDSRIPDTLEDDDDDPSKGLASGPNALPVSPPRRIRRLPAVHQLLDTSSSGDNSDDSCELGCPAGRCTCSRRSSPAPLSSQSGNVSHSADAGSSSGLISPTSASKGKRKRDTSYIRKCSYLQPGIVFTGTQSFTTFASAYSNSTYPTSATRDHHRRTIHPYTPLGREPDPLYIASPGVPSRRFLDTALDHLQTLTRHATASLNRTPFSSLIPAGSSPHNTAAPDSAWSAIEGSAIDPQMQDLLAGNPSYGYTSGDSIARASSTEEWEVQVSISSVDYVRGRVTGIMTALNVPNSLDVPPTPSSVGPSSASLANGLDSSNTVTTSFEGEIIDLRNNGLWTRTSPNEGAMDASHSDMYEDEEEQENFSYSAGSSSSCTGGPWLSSNHVVDKSTDLDYWAKLDAFASYGPLAEKEICKIAREGKWPEEQQRPLVKRPNPQDYILMRWKGMSCSLPICTARSVLLT